MDDLLGRTFGGLVLREEIGRATYKAFDESASQWVVVKVISVSPLDGTPKEAVRARFRSQAKALAALHHPNVLTILSYGEEIDFSYLVTEYMSGGSLKDRLRSDQPFTWEQSLAIALPLSQGLAFAHGHGIIHRDIKPSKILISQENVPLVVDFELTGLDTSRDGTVVGEDMVRMTYYAPERIQEGSADARSDIYSLALVLYEMLAGRLPFDAETPFELLFVRLTSSPLSILEANPSVPPSLEHILDKALAVDPNERYQTMEEFSRALFEAGGQLGQPAKAGGWIASAEDTAVAVPAARRKQETKIVLNLSDTGQQIYVGNQAELIVGRASKKGKVPDPDIDLVPFGGRQGGVSRKHGRLLRIDDRWFVEDLNSTNGTFVNGVRMPPRQTTALHQGDSLRFGRIELKVELVGE